MSSGCCSVPQSCLQVRRFNQSGGGGVAFCGLRGKTQGRSSYLLIVCCISDTWKHLHQALLQCEQVSSKQTAHLVTSLSHLCVTHTHQSSELIHLIWVTTTSACYWTKPAACYSVCVLVCVSVWVCSMLLTAVSMLMLLFTSGVSV